MSATRRKGSRGGRAASRAAGPPASNALAWAESLASGEPAPGSSALEWAEGLAAKDATPSPWGSVGGSSPTSAPTSSAAPTGTADDGSPWGPIPAPAVADAPAEGDANPWGPVVGPDPDQPRGGSKNARGKGGKGGRSGRSRSKGKGGRPSAKGAPKTDVAPTPAGGFPVGGGVGADPAPDAAEGVVDAPPFTEADAPGGLADVLPEIAPEPAPDAEPEADAAPGRRPAQRGGAKKAGSAKKAGTRPRGRLAPDTAQQKRIKTSLRRGLPPLLDRPTTLVAAGVIAALLGLGAGWGTSLTGDDAPLSAADAASCAQTQMAWTQAANAQSAMVQDQPETLRKGFINARNALEGVTPPEAIAEDWAIAYTYYSTVANNIEKVKPNDGAAVTSAVGGAQQELDTDAMVAAFERVQEYVASNCQGG